MRICSQCNAKVPSDLAVCPICGNQVGLAKPEVWPPSTGIGITPAGKLKMDPVEVKKSNILIGIAVLLLIVGYAMNANHIAPIVADVFTGIGLIPWFWELGCYAKAKGYSYWLGAIGLLSCFGLLILILLPMRRPPQFS